MIIIEHATRIVTVNWDKAKTDSPWIALTAVRLGGTHSHDGIKTVRLSRRDAETLAQFIMKGPDLEVYDSEDIDS